MKFSKNHDVMHKVFLPLLIYLLLGFSFFLFFAGHHNPGGGFIGGLMAASALLLIYLFYGLERANQTLRFTYPGLIGMGLLLAVGVELISVIVGDAVFTQYFGYYHLPILGEVELTTALPFDFGVYLVVIGMTMAATVTIAEDDD